MAVNELKQYVRDTWRIIHRGTKSKTREKSS